MIKKAIEKIKEEIEKNKNPYTEIIGDYVIRHIDINPQVSEAIVNGEKTIAGSLKAMRHEASKVKKDNVAVLTDEQGFKIVRDYFGFENIQQNIHSSVESKEEIKATDDFNVILDDFI